MNRVENQKHVPSKSEGAKAKSKKPELEPETGTAVENAARPEAPAAQDVGSIAEAQEALVSLRWNRRPRLRDLRDALAALVAVAARSIPSTAPAMIAARQAIADADAYLNAKVEDADVSG